MREVVVCVHGIWMKGWVMKPISHHLKSYGHDCKQFSYHSVIHDPKENAHRLNQFVAQLDADIVHFVAHSLGGLILLHYFQNFDQHKPGRVVMLGTPLTGSGVARYLAVNKLLRISILGASAKSLLGNVPSWKGSRPLAVFAGNRGQGLGKLLGAPLDKPNDGTVAVSETKIKNCTLHIEIPYSHTSMLLAKSVATSVDEFLRTGDIQL